MWPFPARVPLTAVGAALMFRASNLEGFRLADTTGTDSREDKRMKVINSLKTAKLREKGCRVVRRRGRVYVINKKNPRFKARQG